MNTPLFDVLAGCGGTAAGAEAPVPADELAADMARLDIGRALVRIEPTDLDSSPSMSLQLLGEICSVREAFVPCPVMIPDSGADVPSAEQQVDAAIANGAGAAVVRPARDGWSLEPWCCDPLFAVLQHRRLPVLCLLDQVGYSALAALAGRFPDLPFMLGGVGYRDHRIQVPLLRQFPNIHLAFGGRYCVHHGIEHLTAELGPDRILFGTGWPQSEPMCAISYLLYADIPNQTKALIGAGNMERLVKGIIR